MMHDDTSGALRPSALSSEGFLGSDTRSLEEIVADDKRTLDRLGISAADMATALESVYRKARENLGAAVSIGNGRIVVFHESMGRIPSPLGGGLFEKGEAVVADEQGKELLIITALSIHLIREYGFFQGRGAHFRIDPAKAAEVLVPARR
jgi:hypothetical protein